MNRNKPEKRNQTPNHRPAKKGSERRRLAELAEYYDHQSDDDAIAEAEAAYRSADTAMIQVPIDLVPQIEKLIAKRAG